MPPSSTITPTRLVLAAGMATVLPVSAQRGHRATGAESPSRGREPTPHSEEAGDDHAAVSSGSADQEFYGYTLEERQGMYWQEDKCYEWGLGCEEEFKRTRDDGAVDCGPTDEHLVNFTKLCDSQNQSARFFFIHKPWKPWVWIHKPVHKPWNPWKPNKPSKPWKPWWSWKPHPTPYPPRPTPYPPPPTPYPPRPTPFPTPRPTPYPPRPTPYPPPLNTHKPWKPWWSWKPWSPWKPFGRGGSRSGRNGGRSGRSGRSVRRSSTSRTSRTSQRRSVSRRTSEESLVQADDVAVGGGACRVGAVSCGAFYGVLGVSMLCVAGLLLGVWKMKNVFGRRPSDTVKVIES